MMHHALFLLAIFAHSVTPHPGLYEARQEPSCTAVETVTATTTAYSTATVTAIPSPASPPVTVTTSISIFITTTVTAPATAPATAPTRSSSSTNLPSPTPSTCTASPSTLPDGGFEQQLPWLGQPPTSIYSFWVFNNVHSGTRALQLSVNTRSASGQFQLWQGIAACPGVSYTFVAWAMTPDVSAGCKITWVMNDTVLLVQNFTTTQYEMVTETWVAPVPLAALLILRISLSCDSNAVAAKIVYLDDVSLNRVGV